MTYKRRTGNSPHFRPCSRCDILIRDAECYFFPDSPKVYYCKDCAESLHRMRTGRLCRIVASHSIRTGSAIARALDLDEDEGFDLPAECEDLPRWKVDSPTPRKR